MSIGERIQALRKQRGMSQEQLADALSVSRQAVSKWETDESQPDIERLAEISSMFNVSTDYLIKGEYSANTGARAADSSYTARPAYTGAGKRDFMRFSRISFMVSVIYSSSTVIFLLLGFIWGLWHPGWLVFFIPPILTRLMQHVMSKNEEEYKAFEEAIEREDDC